MKLFQRGVSSNVAEATESIRRSTQLNYEEDTDLLEQKQDYRDKMNAAIEEQMPDLKQSEGSFVMQETLRDRVFSQFIIARSNTLD